MSYDPFQYYRRSLRARKYNYSQGGVYFVTICAHERECLFGEMNGSDVQLSKAGKIVREEWVHTEIALPNVLLDEFVVMPNHLHGIIVMTGELVSAKRRATWFDADLTRARAAIPDTIASVITQFEANTTHRIRLLRETRALPVWQENFDELRIRNEVILMRLRDHIANNPRQWDQDENNPDVDLSQ